MCPISGDVLLSMWNPHCSFFALLACSERTFRRCLVAWGFRKRLQLRDPHVANAAMCAMLLECQGPKIRMGCRSMTGLLRQKYGLFARR